MTTDAAAFELEMADVVPLGGIRAAACAPLDSTPKLRACRGPPTTPLKDQTKAAAGVNRRKSGIEAWA